MDFTNLSILEFKQSIINYVNQVELPMEVRRMVLKEIYDDICKTSNELIKQEFYWKTEAQKAKENKDFEKEDLVKTESSSDLEKD